MPLEIDMLSVGNADAIVIRATDENQGDEYVGVIDGGNTSDGEKVVNHVRKWTDKKAVDVLINTHPDADHLDGLTTVVEQLRIEHVLIHNPTIQNRSAWIKEFRTSRDHVVQEAIKSLDGATSFIRLLDSRGIPHQEPFAGLVYELPDDITLTVLGPSQPFYEQLLTKLAPDLKAIVEEAVRELTKGLGPHDVVDGATDTSPSNNSSVITLLTHQGTKYLFTADAGPRAFEDASAMYSDDMKDVYWLQVPHHGSRGNLSTELIEHFRPTVAFVSAAGGDDDLHPNRAVVELLNEVGCRTFGTNKSLNLYHHNGSLPDREGYTTSEPLVVPDDFSAGE